MKCIARSLLLLLLLLTAAGAASAETRYVSDLLVITVRSAKGNNYETLETLITATPVEILEEDKTYVKVRTPKGNEGYILKQYITKELPKATQIKQLQGEITALQNKLDQQQQQYQGTLSEADEKETTINDLQSRLEQTKNELQSVSADYAQLQENAENVVNMTSENESLIEQNKLLNSELTVLREENQNFHRTNMIQWFLAGAGVFFGGWLIGKISRKKQRGFSRL